MQRKVDNTAKATGEHVKNKSKEREERGEAVGENKYCKADYGEDRVLSKCYLVRGDGEKKEPGKPGKWSDPPPEFP